MSVVRLDYGEHVSQHVERWSPAVDPTAIVVLVHGGYWRARYGADLMHPLAKDLSDHGAVVVNVEYRRIGEVDDPWPAMADDVAAAWRVATEGAGDLAVSVVGHSAGGQLALWLAAESAGGNRRPDLVVALAPVADLEVADRRSLSDGAVRELLGGSIAAVPQRYAEASPAARVPIGVRTLVVHGDDDGHVPADIADAYVDAARRSGDDVVAIRDLAVDHFDVIDPASPVWTRMRPVVLGGG